MTAFTPAKLVSLLIWDFSWRLSEDGGMDTLSFVATLIGLAAAGQALKEAPERAARLIPVQWYSRAHGLVQVAGLDRIVCLLGCLGLSLALLGVAFASALPTLVRKKTHPFLETAGLGLAMFLGCGISGWFLGAACATLTASGLRGFCGFGFSFGLVLLVTNKQRMAETPSRMLVPHTVTLLTMYLGVWSGRVVDAAKPRLCLLLHVSGAQSRLREAVLGFALGAMAGCLLGATEAPVERAVLAATAAAPSEAVMEDMGTFGALGFGTLVGATALTVVMTSVVAGVVLAAAVASLFVSTRSCSSSGPEASGLWASAGIAGAFGSTLSGATLGALVEWMVKNFGMMGLLGALSMFTVLKPPVNLLFKLLWQQGEACCPLVSTHWARERERAEVRELQHRQRVALQIEQTILALERGGGCRDDQSAWMAARSRRGEMERSRMQTEEAEVEQKNLQDWINAVVSKHLDVLAFSGIPMTVVAMVTSGFGLLGYGNHQLVFVAILILVSATAYALLKSSNFQFWMLIGCMAMFVTFIIAILTLHAGQVVVTAAMKAPNQSRERVSAQMSRQSYLEALSAAFLAARLCQLALGAAVGGPLVRYGAGEVRVITGAALVAMALLGGLLVFSPVLGEGGGAGALLGVVGATGVCVGAAAALSGRCCSWAGRLATAAGLAAGAVGAGRSHVLNIGLQLPVALVFATTDLI